MTVSTSFSDYRRRRLDAESGLQHERRHSSLDNLRAAFEWLAWLPSQLWRMLQRWAPVVTPHLPLEEESTATVTQGSSDDHHYTALAIAWLLEMSTDPKDHKDALELVSDIVWPTETVVNLSPSVLTIVLRRFIEYTTHSLDEQRSESSRLEEKSEYSEALSAIAALGSMFLQVYWEKRRMHPNSLPSWDWDYGVELLRGHAELENHLDHLTSECEDPAQRNLLAVTRLTLTRPHLVHPPGHYDRWGVGKLSGGRTSCVEDTETFCHRVLLYLAQESASKQYFTREYPYPQRILHVLGQICGDMAAARVEVPRTLFLAYASVLGVDTKILNTEQEDFDMKIVTAYVFQNLRELVVFLDEQETYGRQPVVAQRLGIRHTRSNPLLQEKILTLKYLALPLVENFMEYLGSPSLEQILDIYAMLGIIKVPFDARVTFLTSSLQDLRQNHGIHPLQSAALSKMWRIYRTFMSRFGSDEEDADVESLHWRSNARRMTRVLLEWISKPSDAVLAGVDHCDLELESNISIADTHQRSKWWATAANIVLALDGCVTQLRRCSISLAEATDMFAALRGILDVGLCQEDLDVPVELSWDSPIIPYIRLQLATLRLISTILDVDPAQLSTDDLTSSGIAQLPLMKLVSGGPAGTWQDSRIDPEGLAHSLHNDEPLGRLFNRDKAFVEVVITLSKAGPSATDPEFVETWITIVKRWMTGRPCAPDLESSALAARKIIRAFEPHGLVDYARTVGADVKDSVVLIAASWSEWSEAQDGAVQPDEARSAALAKTTAERVRSLNGNEELVASVQWYLSNLKTRADDIVPSEERESLVDALSALNLGGRDKEH
ncbi:hypothetical protein EIP91_002077 [Steccherinum ochraceum]|uniref:Uncharacterized protein n=1 Tax=Steccherinum ochraceum TaxID=92696 RepID=A0A4R0RPR3_9APHY|nr:hypothetical protein EIP91_002077 [Steccherinum ochraceum]